MHDGDPSSPRTSGQTDKTAAPRLAPLELWRIADAFLNTLFALFGGPREIASGHSFTTRSHEQLASWLRCAEALMRRLLLIEAAAYPKPNTRPLLRPARPRARKELIFTAEEPEKWRVSFRCFTSPVRAPRDAAGPASVSLSLPKAKRRARISREDRWCAENFKPVRFRSSWPLALRYEALIRVFNDPTTYARRLARRLHATPHRLIEVLRAPPKAFDRIDDFALMGESAETAWSPHISSA
jgi:hypothetical protein